MASDRNSLEIQGTNRKGLTIWNGRLGLGHCHDKIRLQDISFATNNIKNDGNTMNEYKKNNIKQCRKLPENQHGSTRKKFINHLTKKLN